MYEIKSLFDKYKISFIERDVESAITCFNVPSCMYITNKIIIFNRLDDIESTISDFMIDHQKNNIKNYKYKIIKNHVINEKNLLITVKWALDRDKEFTSSYHLINLDNIWRFLYVTNLNLI